MSARAHGFESHSLRSTEKVEKYLKKLLTTEKIYGIIYELLLGESLTTKINKKVVDKYLNL